ncbi:hypothetical protein LguiA_020035 [Lonicera macranthoides]
MYSDRKDYCGGGGGKWFLDDKWMPPSGGPGGASACITESGTPRCQGGRVQHIGYQLNDEVEKRGDVPLIPLNRGANGETILNATGGHMANDDWQGAWSTECAGRRENREMLASRVVAYLNVNTAVTGAGFQASATPQLDQLILEDTQQVQDQDNSSQTIYESWVGTSEEPTIGSLGDGGSRYTAFVHHVFRQQMCPSDKILISDVEDDDAMGGYSLIKGYSGFGWSKHFELLTNSRWSYA